jgi:hypothetical protein
MGATSVTGTGHGEARHKGPHNGRDIYVPLLGPRIIAAGVVTTNGGGGADVVFPEPLPGGLANYSYSFAALDSDQFPISVGGAEDDNGDLVQITILAGAEGANKNITYAVISHGNAVINA